MRLSSPIVIVVKTLLCAVLWSGCEPLPAPASCPSKSMPGKAAQTGSGSRPDKALLTDGNPTQQRLLELDSAFHAWHRSLVSAHPNAAGPRRFTDQQKEEIAALGAWYADELLATAQAVAADLRSDAAYRAQNPGVPNNGDGPRTSLLSAKQLFALRAAHADSLKQLTDPTPSAAGALSRAGWGATAAPVGMTEFLGRSVRDMAGALSRLAISDARADSPPYSCSDCLSTCGALDLSGCASCVSAGVDHMMSQWRNELCPCWNGKASEAAWLVVPCVAIGLDALC